MKHILLVEDEEQLIDIVATVLEEEGYNVKKTLTAEEALEQVPEYKPDLIISDMKMGAMDGFTLFQKVRNETKVGNVPFIFLTALDDSRSRDQADDFVKVVRNVLLPPSA